MRIEALDFSTLCIIKKCITILNLVGTASCSSKTNYYDRAPLFQSFIAPKLIKTIRRHISKKFWDHERWEVPPLSKMPTL